MTDRLAFDEILPRIAELAEILSTHSDPVVVATAGELLDWIDAFHSQRSEERRVGKEC